MLNHGLGWLHHDFCCRTTTTILINPSAILHLVVSCGLKVFFFSFHSACFSVRDWQGLKVNERLRGMWWAVGDGQQPIFLHYFFFFSIFFFAVDILPCLIALSQLPRGVVNSLQREWAPRAFGVWRGWGGGPIRNAEGGRTVLGLQTEEKKLRLWRHVCDHEYSSVYAWGEKERN